MMAKEMTIDEGFMALQNILEKMDIEEVSLEESFKLYKDGLQLVKKLNDKLDNVEKKLIVVNDNTKSI